MIHSIIEYALRNRIIVILGLILLIGFGYRAFNEMAVDVYPDLNAPNVKVITEHHGMAPDDIEMLLTFPVESALNALSSVDRVRSVSSLGISIVTVEFAYGTDIFFARQLVSEKLQLVAPTLPEGTVPPFIGPISSMFADAAEFTIEGDDLFAIRDFAEWELKPRLQTVPGVSNVINFGGFLTQYQVELDPGRMLSYGITPADVVTALRDNNSNSSGGYLLDGPEERIIRGMGRIQTIEDIENVVLKAHDGIPVYIRQVADVKIGAYVRRGTAGMNGREIVAITVQNQYRANVMNTIRGVESVLEDVKRQVGDTMTIETFYTQLNMIMKSIRNLSLSMIIGATLVLVVLFVFLNTLRSALLVAMSIPLSLVIAVLFMRFIGLSFNIMTIGGMAIGLGMIVDSSIIMAENIHRHIRDEGTPFHEALLNGAREVGRPIFFATLILVAVFAPIFTLQGIEGRMFIPLVFAVSSAVFGSLIISLTIIPVFAHILFRPLNKPSKPSPVMRLFRGIYTPLLHRALARPWLVAGICAAMVVLGGLLALRTGTEFMPEMDESSLIMDVLLPPETSLEESSRMASLISQRVTEVPEVTKVVRRTGRARGAEHAEPVNLTESNVVLVSKEERTASITDIKEAIRRKVEGVPGVSVMLNAPLQHRINHVATGTKAALAVKIFGENMGTLTVLAEEAEALMSGIEGVADLRMEQVAGVPQLQIRIDRRRMARHGLNVEDVSSIIETALNGTVATEIISTRKRYDIFVRYSEPYRDTPHAIENILIETPAGHLIPISEVADIVEERNPAIVRRENALRRTMIQCNVSGRDMGSVVEDIKHELQEIGLPDGYFITYGGTYENQMRAMRQLTVAVLVTIAVVFSLLVVSFRSVRQAMLIIINIPLALVGGVLALTLFGGTFSVPSIVGFIALIGIAVQDGIVLVNHINGWRDKGLSLIDAVERAGVNKLRPVLMTTFTTFFGLIPLAIRSGTGSEIQRPLALVIMTGLLFSTMITLIVLPSFYIAVMNRWSKTDL
jgi:heavy metal efflux system protein